MKSKTNDTTFNMGTAYKFALTHSEQEATGIEVNPEVVSPIPKGLA